MFLMCNISFFQPLRTGSFLILLRHKKSDPFILEFWMKMGWTVSERWTNGERKVNAKWAHGVRFVNVERERSGAGSASERMVNAWWTNRERTVNDRKNVRIVSGTDCKKEFWISNKKRMFIFGTKSQNSSFRWKSCLFT